MANVFISHSSADSAWADKLHGWMITDGHQVFLDQHQNDGIVVGDEWERRLYERLRWADAVVCLVTQSYLESVWCAGEIGAARALGIEILPVRVGSADGSHKLLKSIQAVDVSESPEQAQQVLLSRLNVIDGGGGRGWPDDKTPYPGLRSFELDEHRVFFGRGSEITAIAERLRSPERNTAAVLTVVGPSGCGKSSLVRAGVAARIAGEGYWLVVPPIVPGTDPLGSLARALGELARERKIEFDSATFRQQLEVKGLNGIATDLLLAAGVQSRCKLLVVVDQLEELVTQTEADDRAKFVTSLAPALGGPIQVLATVRPEYLDALARDSSVGALTLRLQPIRPLDYEALRAVVEQPARVAGLRFEDGLVDRLITDTGTGDALPLLAFTLRQLARGVGRGGQLTLQRYTDTGGVQGALRQQADEALQAACTVTGLTEEQVIAELLDLVTIDEQGHPSKRRVVFDESSPALAGLRPFLDGRLLTTETVRNTTLVTIAHDSFLVNWPPLKTEIDAHVSALRARRVVENAARDWVAGNHDRAALLQGRPLAKALEDTGAEVEPIQSVAREMLRIPLRPRRRRLTTRVDLDGAAQKFLEVSAARDRARRRWRVLQVLAVMAILAVIAGFAVNSAVAAQRSAREAIAQQLIADARGHLEDAADPHYLHKLLVGKSLSSTQGDPLYQVVVDTASTYKIMQNPPLPGDPGRGVDEDPELAPTQAMTVSGDGGLIATGGKGNTVRLWDADRGAQVGQIVLNGKSAVWGVAFDPGGNRLAVAADNDVQVFDPRTSDSISMTMQHPAEVTAVAFSRDGDLIATGDFAAKVRVWNANTGIVVDEFDSAPGVPSAVARSVAFSPTGDLLAYTSGGGVGLRDVRGHQDVAMSAPGALSLAVAFNPRGDRLAVGHVGGRLQLLDGHTLKPVGELQAHPGSVTSLGFSPDGNRLATGGGDNLVNVWEVASLSGAGAGGAEPPVPEYTFRGHTRTVTAVGFARGGLRIVSASQDGTAREWSALVGQPIRAHQGEIKAVAFSPDNLLVASGGSDGTIRLWNTKTGADSGTIGTPSKPGDPSRAITSLDYNRDGSQIVAASNDGRVSQWLTRTGEKIRDLSFADPPGGAPIDDKRIRGVTFDHEGKRIAAGGFDGVIRVWDAESGRPLVATRTDRSPVDSADGPYVVSSVAFSPDDKYLVTGSGFDVQQPGRQAKGNNLVQIWDAAMLDPVGPALRGTNLTTVYAVQFNRRGDQVMSANSDGTVWIWNVTTRETIGTKPLFRDQTPVYSLALAHNADWIATGAGGGTVRVWDPLGKPPEDTPLQGHRKLVLSVAVSPNDKMIVSGSADGNLRLWPGQPAPADVTKAICDKLTVNPSHAQWQTWAQGTEGYDAPCEGLDPAPDG
jgi:WD40 repeat protein